jgi:hypothetical protein
MKLKVEIRDHFKTYQWSDNEYADWCRANCSGKWDIKKYIGHKITAQFENEQDATLFLLRWS